MYYKFPVFIFLSLFMFSCSGNKSLTGNKLENSKMNLMKIAGEKYKEDYKIAYNSSGEYAIVLKRKIAISKPLPDIKYFVFSLKKKEVIIEDSLKAGNVFWQDKYNLKAFARDQKAESSEQSYIFNVKSKQYYFN